MKMPFEWVVGDSSKGLHGDRALLNDETGHRELHHAKGHYFEVMPPQSVSTGSYLVLGPFASSAEATNAADYLRTRFVRFLVSTILLTQNMTRGSYEFVPDLSFDRAWSDPDLYEIFGLTRDEIIFIESQIKPMTLDGDDSDA